MGETVIADIQPLTVDAWVTITTAVPADARDGQHLITVGIDGTALTADCIAMVKGGRRPDGNQPPRQPPLTTAPPAEPSR